MYTNAYRCSMVNFFYLRGQQKCEHPPPIKQNLYLLLRLRKPGYGLSSPNIYLIFFKLIQYYCNSILVGLQSPPSKFQMPLALFKGY